MSDTIIKSFLVTLGFSVDAPSFKRFEGSLESVGAAAKATGSTVVGIAVAAEEMVKRFSTAMERMYYTSRRTGGSVANLNAFKYGAEQIGLSAEEATGAVESMARAMRLNPGLKGLLAGYGVDANQDPTKVLEQWVQKLKGMPDFIAAQYGEMFGWDADTTKMLIMGIDELIRKKKELNDAYAAAGVDQEAAAKASQEYMNTLRQIAGSLEILADKLAIDLLPAFQHFMRFVNEVIGDLTAIDFSKLDFNSKNMVGFLDEQILKWDTWGKRISWVIHEIQSFLQWKDKVSNGLGKFLFGAGFDNSTSQQDRSNNYAHSMVDAQGPNKDAAKPGVLGKAPPDPQVMFASLEKAYGLPAGLLDAMWAKESARGTSMTGPATRTGEKALGHFQQMAAYRKDHNITDPFDLEQGARGAAEGMAGFLRKYGGDLPKALAAYNWGPDNVDKLGLGNAPAETRDYINRIAPQVHITTGNTTISITGVKDAAGAANGVREVIRQSNAELMRMTAAKVR